MRSKKKIKASDSEGRDLEVRMEEDNQSDFTKDKAGLEKPSYRSMLIGKSLINGFPNYDEFGPIDKNDGLIMVGCKDSRPKKWMPKAEYELIDVGEGYFLIKFSSLNDLKFALEEGPWIIYGHYLTVRKWFANFHMSSTTIESTAVWVRFPGLPILAKHLCQRLKLMGDAPTRDGHEAVQKDLTGDLSGNGDSSMETIPKETKISGESVFGSWMIVHRCKPRKITKNQGDVIGKGIHQDKRIYKPHDACFIPPRPDDSGSIIPTSHGESSWGNMVMDVDESAGNKAFMRNTWDMIDIHKPSIFVVVEPRISVWDDQDVVVDVIRASPIHVPDGRRLRAALDGAEVVTTAAEAPVPVKRRRPRERKVPVTPFSRAFG
ncbi:hypothetical protein F3Y22_tig00110694pilonHSYRG00405 [Hibiscus syriacus]|uniref:DUF4283 domain-containing protein n=1 Tax=Hibiscus syriacus TaxID=106335 RepID=A0A6A2ZVF3_HIBSY|nr:hypothetical protein F3Y22_tig00110694pilonHSYRG00405 [Hibiscus syriacus]